MHATHACVSLKLQELCHPVAVGFCHRVSGVAPQRVSLAKFRTISPWLTGEPLKDKLA